MNESVTNSDINVPFSGTVKSKKNLDKNLFDKVSTGDSKSIEECFNTYSNIIWSLVLNFVSSNDAELVTREIFLDIWKNAKIFDKRKHSEEDFIKLIAVSRIMKFKRSIYNTQE